ncbi:putative GTP diphosphokinase [Slackia sp. CM382]|uniref:RelA/SpoT family protein n=1 Tax=Slackia sp. CM382 TaxID=1111137 RepID=UPI00027C6B7A|nr:bifunctional (p)ppGpp synthetase/guanosine-3',5'-bis(diphosphate) 3'-pyrophosphohydrolase [Slackia sp. CM382]EJU33380.1 putative GTP diphosphokinase [Slackia sp. CM382]MDU5612255.1 bifunctional (p)ppGpp synthetase/guanosine-3',5'-bis(diphosphate) 3'-pyrophosphohydrolase [Slackia sp.]
MTDASSGSMRSKDIVTGAAVLPAAIEAASAPASDTDTTPDERFAKLSELAGTYLSEEDLGQLERAYRFAAAAHKGQRRKSGEPFVQHPIEVAIILTDLKMDVDTLSAALLHDTVEDTEVTDEELAETFNPEVAQLVEGVTKITKIEVESLTDEQAATIRKMFVAMSKDIRVIVIKLADRLHNMRTLSALKEDRRIFKAHETMEIYAPIAHRLGIGSIKWELEDLAFYYLEPTRFRRIARMVDESRADREDYLAGVIDTLTGDLDELGIESRIMGRPKHLWSINMKMTQRGKGFSEIYDLIAVRIIVKTLKDCYSALGAVHSRWHPMPGRFKDYIAMPKINMYQSLHTTVIGPSGRPLEVQIRTEDMHRMSEYGIAAHWRYKEKGAKADAAFDKQIAWLRQMVDLQDETQDSREYLSELKVDLAPTEVFVFTPAGKVISLRSGATPIDFAYAVHTEVGNHCVGAKVDGSIVPLSYELQMGDRVEILTQKSASPSRDWLKLAKTPSARSKIRAYFSRVNRDDDLLAGRDKLAHELKKHGFGLGSTASVRAQREVCEQMGFKDVDDMLVAIGAGKEKVAHVSNRLLEILDPTPDEDAAPELSMVTGAASVPMLTTVKRARKRKAHAPNGIVVTGLDDAPVRLSKCCNPVPGDDIIGFVTRGRGVSVHRADCPNAKALLQESGRIIQVEWEDAPSKETSYQVEVYVGAIDRMNLLRDIINALSDTGVNVLASSTSSHTDGLVEMRYLFQVSQVSNIEKVLADLRGINGVFEARRMLPGESIRHH